jgi:MFS superfamily sulfate permease-like transporter
MKVFSLKGSLRNDLPASAVVFLVALPLCLGIALASGAPPISGLIAGIIGGIVTGILSKSPISVAGPAAGLSSIVLTSIQDLGSFEIFLSTVVIAGFIQIFLGMVQAGNLGYFFPSSVIKGMLAGIGIILILKQIPHALGDDRDYEGDEDFLQSDQENTISELLTSVFDFEPSAVLISSICIVLLLIWGNARIQRFTVTRLIPGPLVAVAVGILANILIKKYFPDLALEAGHLVDLPVLDNPTAALTFPDWSALANKQTLLAALTLAIVASLETLLSIEAADKIDPQKRVTPLNRELKAQGLANIFSGILGGLPVTSVIVRTTANVTAGAASKLSTIFHGLFLAGFVFIMPELLELIPLSALAAILILIGYKLASPALWIEHWKKGLDQFIPFSITIMVIVFSNLLLGVFTGILFAIYFVLKTNHHSALIKVNTGSHYMIKFIKDVSFLNKTTLIKALSDIPAGSFVVIEGTSVKFYDHDILEVINDFIKNAPGQGIQVEVKRTIGALHPYFKSIS